MFTKAALSRSRLALVFATVFAVTAACAWLAPTADAASTAFSSQGSNFFDASLVWLRGGRAPALRNGVLDTPANLTVSTDATPFVAREVTWRIAKSADQDRLDVTPSDSATFAYTLSVTHEIGPEVEWLVFGTIHVHNPNVFDVSGVDVTDAVDNGGTCTVEGDVVHTVTIPGNNTLDFNYFCTHTSAPGPSSGASTATATWPEIGSPGTSASHDAAFDFTGVTPSFANGSVDVVDPQDPDGAMVGSVSVDDPNPQTFTYSVPFSGDPSGTCTSHANTASLTIDALVLDSDTKTVEVCVGTDLTVTNAATPSVTRTYQWGISKSVNQASQTVAPGATASFDYTVDVTNKGSTDAWTTTGTIHVVNPNDWEPIKADVTDAVDNGGDCTVTGGTNVSVPAGGHLDLPYTCTYPSAPSPQAGTSTATATWNPATSATGDGSVTDSAPADFSTVSPTIADGNVAVTDTLGGTLGTASYTDPSPRTFTYSHAFSGDPADTCTSHPNTATFTTDTTGTTDSASRSVDVCVTNAAANMTVTKTAHAAFTRTFKWGLTMSVDPATQDVAAGSPAPFDYAVAVTHDAGTDSNWEVTGTITVSNPNDSGPITLTGVDDAVPGGSCSITSGDPHAQVPASGSVKLDYVCTFTSDPGSGLNTATATWNAGAASTPDGSANGTASFTFGAPTTIVDGSATVTDTLGGTLGTVSSGDASPTTLTDHQTFGGDQAGTCTSHPDTATFTTITTGTTGSAGSSATVCAGADLTVKKTATTSFTRTYKWTITKAVAAPTTVTQAGGSTASFNYTVTVASDGYVDSAWAVSGTITVTNPNDWAPVAVSLADSLPGCTLDRTTVNVPKSGSVAVGYTCPLPNGSSGTNTATATWDTSVFPSPHGSATVTAAYSFGAPTTEVGKSVTVTDAFNGAPAMPLGTGPGTFTYSRSVTVAATGCATYPNTATIVETGQSASASVTACASSAPSPLTGALTMGYWQNKNGQAIIAAADQAKLLAFLKGYAPFSDAAAPLTGYATALIKSASASGSSMNPMLKGQMLATALDVYFSDPAQGGNKINAPTPIGGVRIDLTHVQPIGNTSPAFGGATSMTISQTLAYAASRSNAGGSLWYGNVKTTQELAKDVFDAINNDWAVPV